MKRRLLAAAVIAVAAAVSAQSDGARAAEACDKPTVKTLIVGGKVKPGDAVIIGGCGFGQSLGQVHLLGNFPGGKVKLIVDQWSDTGIGAFVPKDVSGAPDQAAKVLVTAKSGAKSNSDRSLFFEARRERKMVTASDTSFQCASWNVADDEQTCKTGGQKYGGAPCNSTVCLQFKGHPVLNTTVSYGGNHDFQLHLKNGYVLAGTEFWSNSGADFALPYTPPVGPKPKMKVLKQGSEPKVRVTWEAPRPTGWIEYKLKIFVEGPAGLPY